MLALWLSVVSLKTNSHAKICSLHFRSRDLVDYKDGKRLKRDAVPAYNYTDEESKVFFSPISHIT